jgi:holo-[acyl-carrier protein] synthase
VTLLVGVDFQLIDEVRESMEIFGDRFVRRIYTDYEINDCGKNAKAAPALASRFAAKEAVFKILKDGDVVATWHDIEVRRLESGQPALTLHGGAATLAAQQGITTIFVSLSQSRRTAAAVVVAESAAGGDEQ